MIYWERYFYTLPIPITSSPFYSLSLSLPHSVLSHMVFFVAPQLRPLSASSIAGTSQAPPPPSCNAVAFLTSRAPLQRRRTPLPYLLSVRLFIPSRTMQSPWPKLSLHARCGANGSWCPWLSLVRAARARGSGDDRLGELQAWGRHIHGCTGARNSTNGRDWCGVMGEVYLPSI